MNVFCEPSQSRERYAICEKCEHLKAKTMCGICRCFMPIKVSIASMECPLGKWKAITEEKEKE